MSPDEAQALYQIAIGIGKIATVLWIYFALKVIRAIVVGSSSSK